MDLQLLILCGGQSLRMGTPKYMLSVIRSEPIYITLIKRCRLACPNISGLYLSFRDSTQVTDLDITSCNATGATILFDSDQKAEDEQGNNIGPAAGLLAAYQTRSTCHWLVLACDYPLVSRYEIAHLVQWYQAPITCFRNASGRSEPLLAIWSPESLAHLKANVAKGVTGPKNVVRDLSGRTITALDENSLLNANTRRDWDEAVKIAMDIGLDG